MYDDRPGIFRQHPPWQSGLFVPHVVDEFTSASKVHLKDADGDVDRQGAETLFTGPQQLLGLFTFGDVAQKANEPGPVSLPAFADDQLHGKALTILAHSGNFQSRTE